MPLAAPFICERAKVINLVCIKSSGEFLPLVRIAARIAIGYCVQEVLILLAIVVPFLAGGESAIGEAEIVEHSQLYVTLLRRVTEHKIDTTCRLSCIQVERR